MLKNIIAMGIDFELKNFFMNHENYFEEFFIKSLKGTYINYKNNFTKNFKIKSITASIDFYGQKRIFINLSIEDEIIELEFSNNFYTKKSNNYHKITYLDIFYKMYKKFG